MIRVIFQENPQIYNEDSHLKLKLSNLINVANWLTTGGRTCFLQDADTLIMRTPELIEVIKYLKQRLPTIERVASYGRSKTCDRRSLQELKDLSEIGFSRLHVGLESGYDEVLKFMQKGVTAREHIEGGQKVVKPGISLSEYVIPGLGGKKWSEKHALESARVLSKINPDFIRIRSLRVREGLLLVEKVKLGEFEEPSEEQMVDEIGLTIENLHCNSCLISDHILNLLGEIEGRLPQDKEKMLKIIKDYKNKSLFERLEFTLNRRLETYYSVYGKISQNLSQQIQKTKELIKEEHPDAEKKVDQIILALKKGF